METQEANGSSLLLRRLREAESISNFVLVVRLVLTGAYALKEAEPIVRTIQKAIEADMVGAETAVRGSGTIEEMAKTIAELAKRGNCLFGSDQLQLALVAGMKKLDAAA